MTTLFQLFVSGPAIGGWSGKFYSKRVFLTREKAEAYLPEFTAKCCDPKPIDALERVEKSKILELDLDGALSLFMVRDSDRWGHSLNVVVAESEEEAIRLVRPDGACNRNHVLVEPIESKGVPGILWCEDESPDSRRE